MKCHGEGITLLSMTIRTPSSLKWLIDQYQVQSRKLREINGQIDELTAVQRELIDRVSSLAKVIDLHDVPISADDIPPLRNNQKQTKYSYGEITRLIYRYLGSISDQDSATVSEIVDFCIKQSETIELCHETSKILRQVIRKRLKDMAYLGKIVRVECGTKLRESRYRGNKELL